MWVGICTLQETVVCLASVSRCSLAVSARIAFTVIIQSDFQFSFRLILPARVGTQAVYSATT